MELREKIIAAVYEAWSSYDISDDMDKVADSILQIPEIKAGQEALMERRINAMSPSQFGAMLLDQLPDTAAKDA